jgi:hypothetical protein
MVQEVDRSHVDEKIDDGIHSNERKKIMTRKKFDKGYKKDKKYTKKKPYCQAHVGQELNSSDESSESKSDDLAIITIKGKASLNKSLFLKLSNHTCLMAK